MEREVNWKIIITVVLMALIAVIPTAYLFIYDFTIHGWLYYIFVTIIFVIVILKKSKNKDR